MMFTVKKPVSYAAHHIYINEASINKCLCVNTQKSEIHPKINNLVWLQRLSKAYLCCWFDFGRHDKNKK